MTCSYRYVKFFSLFCLTVFLSMVSKSIYADDSMVDPGQITFRESVQMQNEEIDPFTGNLTVTNVDLELPGDGGLSASVIRVYKSSRLTDTAPKDLGLGYGWDIHYGTVKKTGNSIAIELQDGTQNTAFGTGSGVDFVTKDFWKVYFPLSGAATLTMTDGTKITFGERDTVTNKAYATQIKKNNNVINITYIQKTIVGRLVRTVTYFNGNTAKTINFNYNGTSNHLQSISWGPSNNLKYINYTYTAGDKSLETVTFPEGDQWYYEYTFESIAERAFTYHLHKVHTPTGGLITYTFQTFLKGCGGPVFKMQGSVSQKVVNDGVSSETWSYDYGVSAADGGDYTTITEQNSGRVTRYIFFGLSSGTSYSGDCYKYGLTRSKNVSEDGLVEDTQYTWDRLDNYLALTPYNPICACYESAVYVPVLTSENTTVDGTTYSTTYPQSEYDDYGNPKKIIESGNATRTTTKTYWYNASRNMVNGFPSSVTITGDSVMSGTFSSSYTYYTSSGDYFGKPHTKTEYGITTEFGYDSYGNLDWIKDANNHTTYYDWDNGSISVIQNPIYSISRSINWDGTVASETNGRNKTTNYAYDDNMRLTLIDPPLGNSTNISYLYDGNGYLIGKKKTKGSFWKKSYLDGLGRNSGTLDKAGVESSIIYRASGVKLSESSNIGDTINYDALGRVEQITQQNEAGKDTIDYTYINNAYVQILDEGNYTTSKKFFYLGDPGGQYLSSVTDQDNKETLYQYNILGSLTHISQSGVERSFHYDSSNMMDWESHPETGTTTYTRYNNGNLHTKTENGTTITYTYDKINRLESAVSGTYSQNFSYDWADNLTKMTSDKVQIDQDFDAINRMKSRKSTIKGLNGEVSYIYDGNDNVTRINYPSGLTVNYSYNNLNQVTEVSGFGTGSLTNITYFTVAPKIGLLKSYVRSNGQMVSFTWDNRRRMRSSGPAGLSLSYNYDSRNNMTEFLRPGKNQTFGYDPVNRIDSATGPWGGGGYSYDAVGNRESKWLDNATTNYYYSSNRVSSETGRPYNYNGGKVSRIGNYYLYYDPFDNLIKSKKDGNVIGEYLYDAQNNRVYKKAGSETVYYHYDQSGNVLSEFNGSGKSVADYIYLNNTLVAKASGNSGAVAPWLLLLLGGE